MIGIIDYGVGNLRSVHKALENLSAPAVIMSGPQAGPWGPELHGIDKLILPGVGAFGDGMDFLRDRDWIGPITTAVAAGKPILGICLGLQLLFGGSEEDALPGPDGKLQLVPGLGILPGAVVRFREEDGLRGPDRQRLKVPHMGWNTLTWRRDDPLLRGLEQGAAVYFVHSYYPQPLESEARPITSARSEYPLPFTATVWRDNVWATQFHPEKSQRVGMKILANFAGL